MTLKLSVLPWCHVISIGLSGQSHNQKDSNFKICNIVIPWPMEVLRIKIMRGIINDYIGVLPNAARYYCIEAPMEATCNTIGLH